MKRFNIELTQFRDEIRDFVDSLNELCYAIGGAKLVDQVSEEINYRLTDGEDFVKVVSEVYEHIRSSAL